uniref:Cwf19-like C-terminal domain-containing protein n=1 Tax=Arcella intermedia TaxID=1963864 RepID=A0A6B2L1L9_9EUKA
MVCGDVKGQLDQLFERVEGIISTKGNFACLFCVGKFFDESNSFLTPYKNALKKVPLPTYFISLAQDEELLGDVDVNGGQICPNLFYLGKQGIQEIQNLTVGYISAIYDSTKKNRTMDYNYEEIRGVIDRVKHSHFKGVDILLSNEWPKGLLNSLSDEACPKGISMLEYDDFGAEIVSQMTASLAPRYHFSSTPTKKIFYERQPYRNGPQFPGQRKFSISRFFSLGEAFNNKKQRFLYAFSLDPITTSDPEQLYQVPPHTTEFPLIKYLWVAPEEPATKKQKTEVDLSKSRFDGQFMGDERKPNYAQNRKRFTDNRETAKLTTGARAEQCWFCMASAVFEYHLIVSVAKHFYLAIAKGGINDSHLLISPIKHFPSQTTLPPEAYEELVKWMESLEKFFMSRGEVAVFFEHNYPVSNQHLHIQVVPVEAREKNRIRESFVIEGTRVKLDWVPVKLGVPLVKQIDGSYFWVRLPDGSQIIARLEKKIPFSFGRRAIASLLGHPELEDWKSCVQPKQEEEKMTMQLREGFKQYQFKS